LCASTVGIGVVIAAAAVAAAWVFVNAVVAPI
jgi:hypothetical protein